MLDKTDWHKAAENVDIEGRAFIDGQYVDALSGNSKPTHNPAPVPYNMRSKPWSKKLTAKASVNYLTRLADWKLPPP